MDHLSTYQWIILILLASVFFVTVLLPAARRLWG